MPLDVEKYLPYFDTFDISREDKVALIEWLFAVAEAFTDMAFGVHPIQMFSDNQQAFWESAIAAMQDDPAIEAEIVFWFKSCLPLQYPKSAASRLPAMHGIHSA